MSHSQLFREQDARAVIRLIHEACELGDDANAWRSHVLSEFSRMFDAANAFAYVARYPVVAQGLVLDHITEANPHPKMVEYVAEGDYTDQPVTAKTIELANAGAFVAVRREMVDDKTWYGSGFFNTIARRCGYDDGMQSMVPLTKLGVLSGFGFWGYLDGNRFTRRHCEVLDLFHTELARMWERDAARPTNPVSPRQEQILNWLGQGLSEKEIAAQLQLSPHTVHDHVKRIYRRFNVSSRGELYSKAGAFKRSLHPRLTVDER